MGATGVRRPQKRKKDDPDYKYPGRDPLVPPRFGQAPVVTEIIESQRKKAAKAEAQKAALKQMEEHNSCPISHALFVDPVMAEDGQIYERKCIEEWFDRNNPHPHPKSPVTRQSIGKTLKPVPLVRNTIKTLVDGGLLTGDAVDTWKAAVEKMERDKTWIKFLTERVAEGVPSSMVLLGGAYEHGYYGMKKDLVKALSHYELAGASGSAEGAFRAALMYQSGTFAHGVQHTAENMKIAAVLGERGACAQMAKWYRDGTIYVMGIKNERWATFWFKKMRECTRTSLLVVSDLDEQAANEWLAAHP